MIFFILIILHFYDLLFPLCLARLLFWLGCALGRAWIHESFRGYRSSSVNQHSLGLRGRDMRGGGSDAFSKMIWFGNTEAMQMHREHATSVATKTKACCESLGQIPASPSRTSPCFFMLVLPLLLPSFRPSVRPSVRLSFRCSRPSASSVLASLIFACWGAGWLAEVPILCVACQTTQPR